jgi:hypothetical protein
VSHPNEKGILLSILFGFSPRLADTEESTEKVRWVHRDRISDIQCLPKRRVTRLLTFLAGRNLVRRKGHKYCITKKGELAGMYLFISARDIPPSSEQEVPSLLASSSLQDMLSKMDRRFSRM